MRAVVRTNDLVLISLIETLMDEAGIPLFVADAHVSALEGGIGAFPRRLMVPDGWMARARRLLRDAGLGHELEPQDDD
jgi:hypothetical protein